MLEDCMFLLMIVFILFFYFKAVESLYRQLAMFYVEQNCEEY